MAFINLNSHGGRDGFSWLFAWRQSGQPKWDERDFISLCRVDGMVPVGYSDWNRVDSQGNLSGLPSTSISRCQLGSICGWGLPSWIHFPHCQKKLRMYKTWDGILGHQMNKRLESFAPCYSQSLLLAGFKENLLFSGFKNSYKKSAKQENSSLFMKHFVEQKREGKTQTKNSSLRSLEWMPKNLDQKSHSRIPSQGCSVQDLQEQ